MYQYRVFENIVVFIFTEEITMNDVEGFPDDLSVLSQSIDEIFIIGLIIGVASYPTNIKDILKSVNVLQSVSTQVKRIYGTPFNPILSFVSNIVLQVLRLKNNTIEAKDLDDLYRLLTVEAEQFPALKASIVHLDEIKAYINSFE